MKSLLLSWDGRVSRLDAWRAVFFYLALGCAVGLAVVVLRQVIPGDITETGSYHVEGVKALPYIALVFGYIFFCYWSGICVAIKRFHDRNKSALWILIQFVPLIGPVWYFIEVFCLRGTIGENRYGPDPLATQSRQAASP